MRARSLLFLSAFALVLQAQQSSQQSTTYQVDVNGRPIDPVSYSSSQTATGASSTMTTRSLNGRQVPVESTTDHLVSKDANSTVIDRVVQQYGPSGTAGPGERMRIEERKNPDGSTTVQTTTYRADLNGNMQVVERTTEEARGTDIVHRTTVIEKSSINGGLAPVEKKVEVEKKLSNGSQSEATVYRQDVSGSFYAASQETKSVEKSGGAETSDTNVYVLRDGRMELDRRMLGKTVTRADGSQLEQIDVYGRQTASNAGDANATTPRLQEQVTRERTPGPNNTVVETVSSTTRSAADPSRFVPFSQSTTTIHLSTDAEGREVRSQEMSVGRRDPNGRIVTTDHTVQQSVKTK
jgi:hypothetical protein